MDESRRLSLVNLADGAAEDLFDRALAEVLADIEDPATGAEVIRSITITITLKPNERRTDAALAIDCRTKLAKQRPLVTTILLGRADGVPAAVEALRQESLFGDPHGRPKAVVNGGAAPDPAAQPEKEVREGVQA